MHTPAPQLLPSPQSTPPPARARLGGSRLAQLQRVVAKAIMRPLTQADRMQAQWVDGNRSSAEGAADFIKPNDRLTSMERLEIYNRQYWFRLLDCLLDDHPGLCALLGTARFMRVATAYLAECPSRSPELTALGDRLPQFIRDNPALTSPYTDMATEMATLERAQIFAFDAFALPITDPASLARIASRPPDRIFLRLQPHITLLELHWPLDALVRRVIRKQDLLRSRASNAMEIPDAPPRRSIAHRVAQTPENIRLAVHRTDNTIYFKRLSVAQFRLLKALQSGASLSNACGVLQELDEADAEGLTPGDIQSWFHTWASMGFLCEDKKKKR